MDRGNIDASVLVYADPDPYPLLGLTDVLITDYSSIMLDYLVLDRPVILFAFDYAEYFSKVGFYYEYRGFVPGDIASTANELFELVLAELKDGARSSAQRRRCVEKVLSPQLVEANGVYQERLETLIV
jgi:CDP-glycerol glycerophosphotransferase